MNGSLYRDEYRFAGLFSGPGYPWGPMQPGMFFTYPPGDHATISKACRSINERQIYATTKYFITVRHLWRCYCMEVH